MIPNFSIIIPNFNGAAFLPACLESLLSAIKNCPQSKFEIILVDNASTDKSLALFNNRFKKLKNSLEFENYKLKIIQNEANLGFAGAVNKGILAASRHWVVPLNNDLTLAANWFSLIASAITTNKNPSIVAFAGTVLNHDGTKIESQGFSYFPRGKCLNINNGQPVSILKSQSPSPYTIWGAPAALICYQRQALIDIGLFDADFFAYEEDVDLAYRLNQKGFKTLLVPQALSYHLGGATSSRMGNFRQIHDAQNWIFLIIKNYSLGQILRHLIPITIERLRNLSGLIKATPLSQIPQTLFSTYLHVLLKLPLMITKRSRE